MKQYFFKAFLVAGLAATCLPALAQDAKDKTSKKDKGTQTIVITRTGDTNEKTVIEIKGDKVLVNGKENDNKNGDVKVNVQTFNTNSINRRYARTNGADSWVFNGAPGSFFDEDSNRAMLGVVTDENDKGAEIASVTKESAAEKAGLKKGDIITKIGDKKVADADDVSEAVRAHKPGDKVGITVLRDGKEQKLTAELSKWKGMQLNGFTMPRMPRIQMNDFDVYAPSTPNGTFTIPRTSFSFGGPKLGLSIQDTEDSKGVKVTEVDEESNAAKAGIKENDIITHINDKEVTSADQVSRAVRENKDKGPLRFQITRDGKTQNIEVRFPRKLKTADL